MYEFPSGTLGQQSHRYSDVLFWCKEDKYNVRLMYLKECMDHVSVTSEITYNSKIWNYL